MDLGAKPLVVYKVLDIYAGFYFITIQLTEKVMRKVPCSAMTLLCGHQQECLICTCLLLKPFSGHRTKWIVKMVCFVCDVMWKIFRPLHQGNIICIFHFLIASLSHPTFCSVFWCLHLSFSITFHSASLELIRHFMPYSLLTVNDFPITDYLWCVLASVLWKCTVYLQQLVIAGSVKWDVQRVCKMPSS